VLSSQADPLNEVELAELLDYADGNEDGQIDYREFAELLTGSHSRVAQEMTAITDEEMVVAVQLARAQGYHWIKRALGVSGIRATEYLPTPRAAPRAQWRRMQRLSLEQRRRDSAKVHHYFDLQIEPSASADWPIHELEKPTGGATPKEMTERAQHYLSDACVAKVPGAHEDVATGLLASERHAIGRQPIGAVPPPVQGATGAAEPSAEPSVQSGVQSTWSA
jgi:hypothetical protein